MLLVSQLSCSAALCCRVCGFFRFVQDTVLNKDTSVKGESIRRLLAHD